MIKNPIDAAAYSPTISAIAHYHLEKVDRDNTNVYAAELTALRLGIKMAGTSPEQSDKRYILVENRS